MELVELAEHPLGNNARGRGAVGGAHRVGIVTYLDIAQWATLRHENWLARNVLLPNWWHMSRGIKWIRMKVAKQIFAGCVCVCGAGEEQQGG